MITKTQSSRLLISRGRTHTTAPTLMYVMQIFTLSFGIAVTVGGKDFTLDVLFSDSFP